MRRLACVVFLAWPLFTFAAEREAPRVVPPQHAGVGRLLPDLTATDLAGKPVSLAALARGHKAVVVAVTSTSCPLSKKYLPTLARLEAEYGPKGVAFVYVNPLASDEPAAMRKAVAGLGLKGPYIADAAGRFAAGLGAETTGDLLILDATRTVLYRGAVDDQYGLGYALDAPKRAFARDALDAHLAGKPIAVPATTAPGCALDLAPPVAGDFAAVSYHGRVSRVLLTHCVECHRDGGVGPFRLDTLEDVVAHKGMVRKVVEAGTMPPWHAATGAAERGKWANDRSLTPGDKADLLAWLKNGTPAGDPADAPLPRAFPPGWAIGTPDLVVQIPKPIAVKAEGTMPYQNVTVETKLDADRWVQAIEIQPTDRAVVHHVLVFVVGSEAAPAEAGPRGPLVRLREQADERKGSFAAYVPGNAHQTFPAGFAKKLPKGARLRFQIHYTPNGTATRDQLRLGVVYAKAAPEHELKVTALLDPRIAIPAGAEHHRETAAIKVPADAVLLAFMPHMHVRGQACKYELTTPDGATTTLLDVPHYDFNWQLKYELARPVTAPKGSTLRFTAWYDNSDKNPANPDPKADVRWGPQTTEEMMLGYLEYYLVKPPAAKK